MSIDPSPPPDPDRTPRTFAPLAPIARRFVLHWGEMGSRWGVNRTVAQIHAALYIAARPLCAEEIAETLGVARSNVSTSLKELQNWRLARIVHVLGDRRDYFETHGDVWDLFRTVVQERKAREFDPTIAALEELQVLPDFPRESPASQKRIADLLTLMRTLSVWGEEMLRLEPATLMKIMKLGARIQNLVHKSAPKGTPKD
jgi:DNA-binding transcriptional regulator GbsR (MarR family)